MKNFFLGTLATIFITNLSFGQTCDCATNFQWVKETFEKNDAGFQYIIDQKGKDAYEAFNKTIELRASKAKTVAECQAVILDWGHFFRKGHFSFEIINPNAQQPIVANPDKVDQQEIANIDSVQFEKYINSLTEPTPEGIWVSNPYTVGITKTKDGYEGFIIDAPGTSWKKNQVKFKIYPKDKGYTADLWIRDFSKQENQTVEFVGNNLINIGNAFHLKRKSKNFDDTKSTQDYIKFLYTSSPYFQKLSDTTAYLRIPAFDLEVKETIDSIIDANRNTIISTPNLIIDLRFNGGGADASYSKLIPFIYTNPIRTVGLQMLSTKLNNEAMLRYSKDTSFSEEDRKELGEIYEKLNQHPGTFVDIFGTVSIDTLDTILPQPANVAIIINNGNASTTEQFLLAAKQSKKVKLFGTTTFGALDISNMNYVKSPDGNFELGYCLSKSYRIPDMAIDGKGIQPDYYIDTAIPNAKWVDFVQEILEK
jgi:hypothetical protein